MDILPADADARHDALIRYLSAAIFLLLLAPLHGNADGGALQFRKSAGPYTVTLFSAPVPLRVGVCDLSILIQRTAGGAAVLDATVSVTATKADQALSAAATRELATNKLLYAANIVFPSSGVWHVRLQVEGHSESAVAAGDINVLDAQPPVIAYWPYFAVVPLAILLFVLNQWLKNKRRLSRFSVRP